MSVKTSPGSAPGSPDCGDVSIIFVGKSDVGKSALLNAVREMTEDDVGSAPVGAVVKSEKPIMYPDPIYNNLLLWERSMEGKGHADQWMREADLIVLVTDTRFEDSHGRLVLEARQAGKKVYFARTKVDLELHTLKRLMGQRYDRSKVLQALREACTESLGTLPLVDPFKPTRFSFEEFSEKEIAEIQEAYELGGLSEVVTRIQGSLETIWNAQLDIAITGESGAGKSTFVNVLRGMTDEEEGAAATGVTETTMKPTPYPYPEHANVVLWDLPGIGTPNFRADKYLEMVEFSRYDFFIILASERFKENHVHLAQAIVQQGKQFYFIRTKIDNDLEAEQRKKNPPTEAEVLEVIKKDCQSKLSKAGLSDAKVFLLSSFYLDKFDFQAFQETLEQELPTHKQQAFLLSLPNVSTVIIEKKKKVLQREIWKVALISSLVAAVPLPGVAFTCDVTILLKKLSSYRQDFGLDAASLSRLAERSGKSMEILRKEVHSCLGRSINKDVVISLLGKATGTGLMVANFFLHRFPIYGALASGGISFHTTYSMLGQCLEELAADSQRVLMKACESDI
ncbi:hypothetical protein E2320_000688 [Naja naja]|nr:hypothetical protein E2320_000688 [Naja naja]